MLVAGLALLGGLAVPTRASADTASIPGSADPSWTGPAHQSPLEVVASRIASRIAGRAVTVRCGASALGDPRRSAGASAESGSVVATWDSTTGQLLRNSSSTELAGREVCDRLHDFATAATKPTKCLVSSERFPTTRAARLATRKTTRVVQHLGPCYLGDVGKAAKPMAASYWSNYESYAVAILTLAHESIHLRGVVGGQLTNGLLVGDQQAEAKADCYGMQSIAFVAEQLGDTPDDAQAIATYFWDKVYPRAKSSSYAHYWSSDCRPGGSLDLRAPGAVAWP